MDELILDQMRTALESVTACRPAGRVTGVTGNQLFVSGLPMAARLGDRVALKDDDSLMSGEIIKLGPDRVEVLMDGFADGISIGTVVRLLPPPVFAPHDGWIGRIIDPDGKPLDGLPLLPGPIAAKARGGVLPANDRRPLGDRLETGIAALNTLLPLVKGQRVGLFAGSGVGKSTLLAKLAKGISADVIVIALVGERGREVRDFTQNVLGEEGMARAVVVAATSDRAPNVRRRCAWSATAVAEHFRDAGKQVLLLCDSVTRFCEAHREIAVAAGESANLRGFPASTSGAVAALCERAGPGTDGMGDISAIYTVLVAGSDMEEPVADMMRGILDGHIVLDRQIAEAGRFPAIDVLRSVSRSLPQAADPTENELISLARKRMADYDASKMMIKAGLYEEGIDADLDAAVSTHPLLEMFLSMTDGRASKAHFASLRQSLDQGARSQ